MVDEKARVGTSFTQHLRTISHCVVVEIVVEQPQPTQKQELSAIKRCKVEVGAPYMLLFHFGMMREVGWNDWGDEVRGVSAIAFVEVDKSKKA